MKCVQLYCKVFDFASRGSACVLTNSQLLNFTVVCVTVKTEATRFLTSFSSKCIECVFVSPIEVA